MTQTLKILNWNVEANRQTSQNRRGELIQQTIEQYPADVICLTEAAPKNLPIGGQRLLSELSGWGWPESKGARKVLLWSRDTWENVDTLGSERLPEGRYVSATTHGLHIVGMVIPYHAYRTGALFGENRKRTWQGAEEYLTVLHEDLLQRPDFRQKTILMGDFNLQIPPKGYPSKSSMVNQLREETLAGWTIPTAGPITDPALDKPLLDHVALTPDIEVLSLQFISRFTPSGQEMSDHNGVYLEIRY